MKKAFLVIALSFVCYELSFAQEKEPLFTPGFSLNVMNSHLWRGIEVEDGLIFTPDLSVTTLNKQLCIGVWGAFNTTASFKEFDYYLTYNRGGFHFYLWDVFNFSPGAEYNNRDFFNYKASETGRFIDATVGYTFNRFPLTLNWSTILFGRDRDALNAQNRYSSFVYGEYSVYRKDNWKVDAGLGCAFALSKGRNAEGERTAANFFADKPGIVHISLKTTYNLTILEHDFPIYLQLLWNPIHDKGFMQIGAQLFRF